ncbi:MAG: hypothetical protein ACYC9L_05695 [Sulfuricaulis sp.]
MRRKHREALALFEAKGYDDLATYNSECARGIVHTPEWDLRMVAIQSRFIAERIAEIRAEAKLKGWIIYGTPATASNAGAVPKDRL